MEKHGLLDILSVGRAGALTAKELAKILGYKDTRDITEEIHRLRVEGNFICASCCKPFGYYIAADERDIEGFYLNMEGRIKQMKKRLSRQKII